MSIVARVQGRRHRPGTSCGPCLGTLHCAGLGFCSCPADTSSVCRNAHEQLLVFCCEVWTHAGLRPAVQCGRSRGSPRTGCREEAQHQSSYRCGLELPPGADTFRGAV